VRRVVDVDDSAVLVLDSAVVLGASVEVDRSLEDVDKSALLELNSEDVVRASVELDKEVVLVLDSIVVDGGSVEDVEDSVLVGVGIGWTGGVVGASWS
jgi:hypothetical protein